MTPAPTPKSPPPQSPGAHRPALDERRTYAPRSRQERFIVPLIADAVAGAISAHAVRGGRALDVGCGGQPFRPVLEAAGMSYASMDTQAQPGQHVDLLAPIDVPISPETGWRAAFDLILCTEVLEHVADWPAAWSNLAGLLRPGGRLIVTCPFVYPLHEQPYDFFRPTTHALRAHAERTGLEVVALERLGTAGDAVATLLAASSAAPRRAGPIGAVAAAIARPASKLAFRVAQWAARSRLIQLRGELYLANFAVLGKPATTPQDAAAQ